MMRIAGISFIPFAICTIAFRPSGQREATIILSAIPLGLFFGLAGLKLRTSDAFAHFVRPGARARYYLAAVVAIGLGFLIYWCGMCQFGGYDCSVSIDAGWRLINGQRPYIDFPCTLPVGFYLGSELAFRLFGVFWRSQVLIAALYAAATFLWLWKLLDAILDHPALAILIAFCCEAATMLVISYWWYNPVTTITATICVTSCIAALCFPESLVYWVSLSLSLFLLALMKPNISGIVIAGCVGPLYFLPKSRVRALMASISAFALWLMVLKVHGSSVHQVLGSYLSVANRGLSLVQFMQDLTPLEKVLSLLALCGSCLPWIGAVLKPARLASARSAISLFALAAGTYGFISNNDLKVVDLPLQLLSGIFLIALPEGSKMKLTIPGPWKLYLVAFLSVLTSVSIAQAVTRHRVQIMGYGLFFEYELRDAPLSNDFFRGLDAGNNLEAAIERISDLTSLPNRRPIFFGPRLQWAYAAFRIGSPRNEPIWWHPGVAFAQGDEAMYLQHWLQAGFDSLVFLDPDYYSRDFQKVMDVQYGIDPALVPVPLARDPYRRNKNLPLLVLKKRPLPAAGTK